MVNRYIFLVIAASLFGLALPAPGAQPASDLLKQLSVGAEEDELLPPERAFAASLAVSDATTLVATFTPADGYYLYRDKFSFRVRAPADVAIARVDLPRGKLKDDPFFGKIEIYDRAVQATIKLDRKRNAFAGTLKLHIIYQGCNVPLGVCYLPIERTLEAMLPALTPKAK